MNGLFGDPGLRKKVIVGGVAVAALALAVVVFAGRGPKPSQTAAPAPALTVTATTPRHAMWSTALEVSGAVAPWQEAVISTQIGGYQLTEVLVNVGDQVKKGQVLARVNPALLRADEALLRANFEQAEANYKRALTLKDNGFISDQNILQLETQVKTTRAQLEAKQLQLRYTEIVAPDDGAISARTATLGSVVATGQELFRLVRQNRLEWRAELTARQLALVQPGQEVRLMLPGGAAGEVSAEIRQVAPTLNADSRLGLAYADIEPGSAARAGMYVTGRIVTGEQPALVVPAEAVVLRDGHNYVLELEGRGPTTKIRTRAVETGRRQGADIEIVDGLADGALIAVRGAGFLNDGDVVRVVEDDVPEAVRGAQR